MAELSDVKWKEFSLTEIFPIIKRGKRLKKSDHLCGAIPYVSSTATSNGVDGFIGNQGRVRVFNDCLTVANSGSVGSTFYHSYQFIASDHVTQLKREGLDKYAYLFLAPLVQRLSEKYSFNREINDDRLKREKLIIPVNERGEMDFEFMSNYMREIEIRTLKPIIDKLCIRLIHSEISGGVIRYIRIGNRSLYPKYSQYYRVSA